MHVPQSTQAARRVTRAIGAKFAARRVMSKVAASVIPGLNVAQFSDAPVLPTPETVTPEALSTAPMPLPTQTAPAAYPDLEAQRATAPMPQTKAPYPDLESKRTEALKPAPVTEPQTPVTPAPTPAPTPAAADTQPPAKPAAPAAGFYDRMKSVANNAMSSVQLPTDEAGIPEGTDPVARIGHLARIYKGDPAYFEQIKTGLNDALGAAADGNGRDAVMEQFGTGLVGPGVAAAINGAIQTKQPLAPAILEQFPEELRGDVAAAIASGGGVKEFARKQVARSALGQVDTVAQNVDAGKSQGLWDTVLDFAKEPRNWIVPAAAVAALFGGTPGKVIGALAAGYGAYDLYNRYNSMKALGDSEDGQKAIAGGLTQTDEQGKPLIFNPEYIKSLPPELQQPVRDYGLVLRTGLGDQVKVQAMKQALQQIQATNPGTEIEDLAGQMSESQQQILSEAIAELTSEMQASKDSLLSEGA